MKRGADLVLDRGNALWQRIASRLEETTTPPTTVGDERLADNLAHWHALVREILDETREIEAAHDRLTALLALPKGSPVSDIVTGVEIMLKRLQVLEAR